MKFELGKMYKIRDGRKAQIFMLDNGTGCMLGAIQLSVTIKSGSAVHPEKSEWLAEAWNLDGCKSRVNQVVFDGDIVSEWTEPKKPRLMAPCLHYTITKLVVTSSRLYESEEEAKRHYENYFISWPAVVNADGMFEVSE